MKAAKCRCGAESRIRIREPYLWVECKKKCGMKTGVFRIGLHQSEVEEQATVAWNKVVKKDG